MPLLLFIIACKVANLLGKDAVIIPGRAWRATCAPWLETWRHSDGSRTIAMGDLELTYGPYWVETGCPDRER